MNHNTTTADLLRLVPGLPDGMTPEAACNHSSTLEESTRSVWGDSPERAGPDDRSDPRADWLSMGKTPI